MSNILKVLLISAVPIFEQRASIPMGILVYKLNIPLVFFLSFIGSLLPVPFILLFFNKLFKWMKQIKYFKKINDLIEKKICNGSKKIEKYKELSLITFIGIPLPTTGLWTGSAVAAFLGLNFKKSLMCATIGALISASLITAISIIFPKLLGF